MKPLAIILATFMLTGCAGLKTAWRLQLEMQYATPEETKPEVPEVPALPSGKAV